MEKNDRVTFEDLSLGDITLETLPRLAKMRERHFNSFRPEICTELPLNITRYLRDLDQEADPPGLRAGKLYQYVLEKKTARIAEDNLLAGTTSTKDIGVMLYPDLYALVLWPELETMATRKQNPFKISPEDIKTLNFEVFPFWLDRNTVMEVTRKAHGNPPCAKLM
ncbi:MAG: pyruvate formate lyase family protein, partial [Desulfobaccales bacterium]